MQWAPQLAYVRFGADRQKRLVSRALNEQNNARRLLDDIGCTYEVHTLSYCRRRTSVSRREEVPVPAGLLSKNGLALWIAASSFQTNRERLGAEMNSGILYEEPNARGLVQHSSQEVSGDLGTSLTAQQYGTHLLKGKGESMKMKNQRSATTVV
ncbi:uncharacterized protein CIMG_13369 [Coccidioides immitis RS]|uniref:Uncharacterized protein n=1 Tax=Coccidioides immitis (strain RS) TaxID=246410 RepID=A0A0D8JXJ3_COCIM|nr:uncharacterized protein CIMG_13369 [Coccidioides immitis RS]KJF60993.1 hypothetical protein CIMG_13369 [Coccidioides immitis RS]